MSRFFSIIFLFSVAGCVEQQDVQSQSTTAVTEVEAIAAQNLVAQKLATQKKAQEREYRNRFSYANIKNTQSTVSVPASNSCSMVLQFVSNTPMGLPYIQSHMSKFSSDKRLSRLPICVNQPIWLDESLLSCSSKVRLECDLAPLVELAEKRHFTHLVVIAEKGKANVHNGIMYLDFADTYSVFVHELAHFVGFVDEYPLSSELSNFICEKNTHPNISVYKDASLAAKSMFSVRTCDNHANQAFKLVPQMTFMEYHDVGLIPDKYLDVWVERLATTEHLTPVYVNFAQHFEALNDPINADKWWQSYRNYL